MPSREGLDQFKAELKTTLAERLNEQTWRVVQVVAGALVLNVFAIVATGLALYNALRP